VGIVGIDHVQLAAPSGCEADARRFYGGVLGLVEVAKPEALAARGGVWFSLGAQQLHIGIDEQFSPARKAHPGLRVAADSFDALAERLAAVGVSVTWDHDVPTVRRYYTQDPWGNRIELLAHL
jgi:catechol 2,3-dioxygenase-like lactoylglutathione lyase family enzyme